MKTYVVSFDGFTIRTELTETEAAALKADSDITIQEV